MNLSDPIRSVIPSSHGAVLEVLARTETPLTGRTVAALTDSRVGQSRTNETLRDLVSSGLVLKTEHPPANLYVLNRDHVASAAIEQLARLREALLERMRHQITSWQILPAAAWLFGSSARGEGDLDSDIDVLLLMPDGADGDATDGTVTKWMEQVDTFCDAVSRWSGNDCRVVEFSEADFELMLDQGDRLALEVVRDGVHLGGKPLPKRGRTRRVSTS